MVTSLKHEVARLEASRLAFGVEKLKRKRLGRRDNALRAVWRNQRFDRTVCVGETKHRAARLDFNRSRRGKSERRRCRKHGRL